MQREAPDTHFYAEIRDLNLEFLHLIAESRDRSHGRVFGLDSAIVHQIAQLTPDARRSMAAAPCLLAGFSSRGDSHEMHVAEPRVATNCEWSGQARLFAAGLLTYLWQTSRRGRLCAALCGGGASGLAAGEMSFREIRMYADRALQHLEARFRSPARFWPDLVKATREGNPDRLRVAQLTAIQLATREAGLYCASAAPGDNPPSIAAGLR